MTNKDESAYAFVDNRSKSYEDNEVHYGFSKGEEAQLRFMCALISGRGTEWEMSENEADTIAAMATLLSDAYFKSLK